jgi:hypothetical protein
VVSDFVRLREESSYLEMGMLLEGGTGLNDLMADDEDNYQMGELQQQQHSPALLCCCWRGWWTGPLTGFLSHCCAAPSGGEHGH